MATPTPFGALIASARRRRGLSLRALARAVGCSHVFLGEVERGDRPRLGEAHWPALGAELHLQQDQLRRASELSMSITLRPTARNAPMLEALAHRLDAGDLTETDMQRLMQILA